jgi:hypothetical protein
MGTPMTTTVRATTASAARAPGQRASGTCARKRRHTTASTLFRRNGGRWRSARTQSRRSPSARRRARRSMLSEMSIPIHRTPGPGALPVAMPEPHAASRTTPTEQPPARRARRTARVTKKARNLPPHPP